MPAQRVRCGKSSSRSDENPMEIISFGHGPRSCAIIAKRRHRTRGRESTMKAASSWLLGLFVLSAFFTPASAFEDVSVHPSCAICGMDREAYGHSRMLIVFKGGASYGLCSLRCAALILKAEEERKPRSVKAADYNTRELIEADQAQWVIGGEEARGE